MNRMHIVSRLVRIARDLLAASPKRLDEGDDLEREFKKLVENEQPAEFMYTKKDGSQKKRVVMPLELFKMKGRWAIKGYEVDDRRQVQKMFYLDHIGDLGDVVDSNNEPSEADKSKFIREYIIPRLKKNFDMNAKYPEGGELDDEYDGDWFIEQLSAKDLQRLFNMVRGKSKSDEFKMKFHVNISRGYSDSFSYNNMYLTIIVYGKKDATLEELGNKIEEIMWIGGIEVDKRRRGDE